MNEDILKHRWHPFMAWNKVLINKCKIAYGCYANKDHQFLSKACYRSERLENEIPRVLNGWIYLQ